MKWSLKIGQFRGIGVYVHATFLLIIIWVAYINWSQSRSLEETIYGIIFVLAIFACVVFHEFGHALTAQKYGIRTRDITLLPIGGVARLEHMPEDPRQEFWVAIAGPAVNVVISVVIAVFLAVTSKVPALGELGMMSGSFLSRLMVVNIFLVVFNLIPAFPMDGGRILRAVLAMRMNYTRATQIAANLGQAIAFMFAFFGFFYNPFLIFIALFVWIGAAQEARMTEITEAFEGIPVKLAMIRDFYTLHPTEPLARAVELILKGSQQDFPVVENGRVVGILTRGDLMNALARGGEHMLVGEAMQREFETTTPNEMLQNAFLRLQNYDCRVMPVVKDDQLVGILNMENIGEFIMIHAALQKSGERLPEYR